MGKDIGLSRSRDIGSRKYRPVVTLVALLNLSVKSLHEGVLAYCIVGTAPFDRSFTQKKWDVETHIQQPLNSRILTSPVF